MCRCRNCIQKYGSDGSSAWGGLGRVSETWVRNHGIPQKIQEEKLAEARRIQEEEKKRLEKEYNENLYVIVCEHNHGYMGIKGCTVKFCYQDDNGEKVYEKEFHKYDFVRLADSCVKRNSKL